MGYKARNTANARKLERSTSRVIDSKTDFVTETSNETQVNIPVSTVAMTTNTDHGKGDQSSDEVSKKQRGYSILPEELKHLISEAKAKPGSSLPLRPWFKSGPFYTVMPANASLKSLVDSLTMDDGKDFAFRQVKEENFINDLKRLVTTGVDVNDGEGYLLQHVAYVGFSRIVKYLLDHYKCMGLSLALASALSVKENPAVDIVRSRANVVLLLVASSVDLENISNEKQIELPPLRFALDWARLGGVVGRALKHLLMLVQRLVSIMYSRSYVCVAIDMTRI